MDVLILYSSFCTLTNKSLSCTKKRRIEEIESTLNQDDKCKKLKNILA